MKSLIFLLRKERSLLDIGGASEHSSGDLIWVLNTDCQPKINDEYRNKMVCTHNLKHRNVSTVCPPKIKHTQAKTLTSQSPFTPWKFSWVMKSEEFNLGRNWTVHYTELQMLLQQLLSSLNIGISQLVLQPTQTCLQVNIFIKMYTMNCNLFIT